MEEEINLDHVDLAVDIRTQNFDVIRLASYRTAVKFRFIQRRTHLHLVDVWNLIEAYRENGFNSVEPYTPMTLSRLETLLATLYIHLNKRVPAGQQLHVLPASQYLMKWITSVYNLRDETDRIPVFTVKMVLATLCGGKLADKLRYIFSQMSDSNGQLMFPKFEDFLRQCCALAAAVGEEPTFHYKAELVESVFSPNSKVTVNDFLDTLMGESNCTCIAWLPLVHRITAAESVIHNVECVSCGRSRFAGLRYQCTRCPSAWSHQCQECFWRGLPFSDSHKPEHEVREYHTPKSPKHSSLGSSLRRSLRCVRSAASDGQDQNQAKLWRTLEGPERPVTVTYTPSAPSTLQRSSTLGSCEIWSGSLPHNVSSLSRSWSRGDDEHGLIARYAAKLAEGDSGSSELGTSSNAQQLLSQLEAKNQEILREIARIRREQEVEDGVSTGPVPLMEELAVLRQRKVELEQQLTTLQDSRKHLMVQLETLMKMIKNQQLSPRSTPSSSSPSGGKSPPTDSVSSLPPNSTVTATEEQFPVADTSSEACGSHTGINYHWRQDLLSAADSVTDAMSSLVKEYNADSDDGGTLPDKVYNGKSPDVTNGLV